MSAAQRGFGTPRGRSPIPVLQGILPIRKKQVPAEIAAGLTLAALAIPEVMAYTKISGTPVVTGLYTILLPSALFALFGSSRHLVVGADSATAAIAAAGLGGLASTGSREYVALSAMLAIIAGGLSFLARLLGLGFLANFLSRTVLIGFLTGVGIRVASGQVAGVLGIEDRGSEPVHQIVSVLGDLGNVSPATLVVSAAVLLLILGGEKLYARIPWALVAVAGAIAASALLGLSGHGVSTIGTVPQGLPHFGVPRVSPGDSIKLLGTAASVFVVIVAQSAATSRAYASNLDEKVDENADLLALGLANIGAGLSGTFVVNGSPTKTAMAEGAGGRTQLAQLSAAAGVLAVLLFLTRPLAYLPNAVLATVVLLIGIRLVDVRGMRTIRRQRPVEFGVALITAATVVFVGVEEGIVFAIVLSMIAHLRHSYHPEDRLLVTTPSGTFKTVPVTFAGQAAPGLVIYRFGASLYYANASRFEREVTDILEQTPGPVSWFCLAAESMNDIDFTGSGVLRRLVVDMKRRGIQVVLCDVRDLVRFELKKDGIMDLVGEEHLFGDNHDVLSAYLAASKAAAE